MTYACSDKYGLTGDVGAKLSNINDLIFLIQAKRIRYIENEDNSKIYYDFLNVLTFISFNNCSYKTWGPT